MRFRRSVGLTPSEALLARLCDNSFLKLWTYPNLFRKAGKELTDLLVVFGNDVIIFSDKSCGYPDSGDPALDWSRWYRRSVADSAHQIETAERWLRSCPDRIFLDAKCVERLPIALPPAADMRVHRVCIALGALNRAEAETQRRALRVNPRVANQAERFTLGRSDKARGWLHFFDEVTLAIVLRELSTTADFVHYLNSKVALFESQNFQFADSELDILGYYLWNGRSFPEHRNQYRLDPGLWPQVEASPEFLAGREANKVSFFWDGLIEYVTEQYLDETLEFGNDLAMSDYERLARIMASETRFNRRVLTMLILERAEIARHNAISTLLPSDQPDVNYVLLVGRGDQGGDHNAYRADRMSQLRTRCIAAKAAKPDRRYVVGIGLDARGVQGSSEDFVLMDTIDWTQQDVEHAEALRQDLGYFIQGRAHQTRFIEDEYPGSRNGRP